MKRKLIVVFMTIVMAVSLAFGMSIMTVGAADELTLGDVSTTYTSGTAIEISCSQFTTGGDEQELGGNSLTYVTVTSGGSTYNASNVRQIVSRKSLRVYFNGTGYSFSNAKKGDLFTVKQGMTSTKYPDLTVSEDINYIFTGSSWIKGKELPTEAEALVLGDVSLTNGNQIEIANTQFTAADEKELAINGKEYIVLTGADGETYTPSHVRQMGKVRKAFKLYFNNANANGKKYSFASSAKGDLLTVKKGLTITGNEDGAEYNIEVKADINYIYTGSAWISGTELPAEKTELTVSTLSLSSAQGKKDALLYLTTGSDNTADLGDANQSFCLNFVELNFADGTKGDVWYARICKNEVRFFVHNKNGSGNMNTSGLTRGDKFVVKTGFAYSATATSEVKADKNYIYDGSAWIEGTELPKNGIDTKEKELTLYKGDEFVLPELFYTYTTEVKVPETVDADDVTIENAPDMNTVNENGYQVTLKVGDFSVDITVKVLDTTELNVTDVAPDNSWSKIAITTDSVNKAAVTTPINEYVKYFVYERNGVQFTVSDYIIIQQKYLISVQVGKTSDNKPLYLVKDEAVKVGDLLTVKKGLPFINGERLTETVTYVYNGTKFVKLVEPETFDVDATMSVFVNGVKQINVKDDAAVTAVYKYASSDDTVATVSETGVVKGIKVGTAKITVSYKDVSKEITVTVSEEPAKKGIEIVSDIEIFYVPVATATADNNFTSMGYTLLARYLYVDGSVGDVFDVEASQIGDINYTVAGLKDLTITIGEFTATVKVNVYEYKNVTSFTSLGVSGYDVNDDRNQPGTWNGHMIIGMNSISTSKGNMLSTESSEKMSEYIVYETAEGNKYYGKADKDNDIIDRIGVWQLGTNLLIMIKPEGSNANVGYGSEDHWKSDASYGYVPVYKAGDKITFLAGMPIYAWKGSLGENNYPAEGKGCLIVEGYVTEDIVYYCYEEDGVKSLWQIYKEYTDFTVNPSVTLTVGGTGSIGAVKTPIDATTGKFTYESSDPAVVTVTKDGNLAGLGIGTATVTVTLTGGKDADGNALDPIIKTVTVTVKKGIKSVSGEITVTKGATIDLADYEITVRYTDGTEENISLGANNVIVEDIDTSVTGTTEYGVRVTIDGETKRGTLTVTVKDAKKGCKGDVVSVSSILGLAFVTAGVIIVRKKSKKA